MIDYKIKVRLGIDDLYSLYAFAGVDEQGIGSSNSIKDYLTSDGWLRYVFDVPMTDECIAAEIERRKDWNIKYIDELHRKGEYGKVEYITLSIEYNPALDAPSLPSEFPIESYSFILMDTSL